MAFCCVPQCNNKMTTDGISLHTFPKDPHVHNQWLRLLKNAKLVKSSKVCSVHFQESDFVTRRSTVKYRCLKSTAVPSIFPWSVRPQYSEAATIVPDYIKCGEIQPVETPSYQYIDAYGNTVTISHAAPMQHNISDVTWTEPTEVKEESDTIPSELLLIAKPDPDSLVPEDAVPESLLSSVRVKDELIPGPNEYVKIVDIQDIFKRKDPPVSDSQEDIPKIESVVSLLPYIKAGVSTSSQSETKNSSSDLNVANKEIQDILNVGVCIQCQECKQFLTDMTVIKSHKCTVPISAVSTSLVPDTGSISTVPPNLVPSAGPSNMVRSTVPISTVPSNMVRTNVQISAMSPNLVRRAGPILTVPSNMVHRTVPNSMVPPNLVPGAISTVPQNMVVNTRPPNLVRNTIPISALSPNIVPGTCPISMVPSNMVPGAVPLSALPSNMLTRDAFGNIQASECSVCRALFISDAALQNHMRSDHSQINTNQSNLVLLPSSKCLIMSTSPVVHSSKQPECIDLEGEEISQSSSLKIRKVLSRSQPTKGRKSHIFIGTAEHEQITVIENDSVESPFRTPAKLRTYGKSTSSCKASADPIPIEVELEPFISELVPDLSAAIDRFYSHFCKFHYGFNQYQSRNNLITIPHLIETVDLSKHCTGQFECEECSEKFNTSTKLNVHLKTNHPTSDTRYVKCKVCNFYQFFNVISISKHLQKHKYHFEHFVLPETLWQCIECEILSYHLFKNGENPVVEIDLKNINILKSVHDTGAANTVYFQYKMNPLHPSEVHRQISYSCGHCSHRFHTSFELDRHIASHGDFVFVNCSQCKLKCMNMNLFYEHVQHSHKQMLLPEINMTRNRSQHISNTNEITCFKHPIPLQLTNNCSLHIHIGYHHSSDLLTTTSEDNFQCPFCEVTFTDAKLFYAHCVPYTPLLPNLTGDCLECGLHFKSKAQSRAHLQLHGGRYAFCCRICRKTHSLYSDLENHVENEHNVSMFHCVLCKTDFFCNDEAMAHLNFCNGDFICSLCGYICDNLDFLIIHLTVELHGSVPKHQCRKCLNFFYSKFNLSCHLVNSKCDNEPAQNILGQ